MSKRDRIIKVLEETLGRKLQTGSDTNLNNLDINSLSFIKIIVGIENEFDITFDDDKMNFDLFGNIDDIVSLVEETQKEQSEEEA